MHTLPGHLFLAAMLLTLCCAERQAVSADRTPAGAAGITDFQPACARKTRATVAGDRQQVRPAQAARPTRGHRPLASPPPVADRAHGGPDVAVVHGIYPPSRFRLPPPAV